jgi:hypothetical protein
VVDGTFLRSPAVPELDLGNRVPDFSFREFRTPSSKNEIAQQPLDFSNSFVVLTLRNTLERVPSRSFWNQLEAELPYCKCIRKWESSGVSLRTDKDSQVSQRESLASERNHFQK